MNKIKRLSLAALFTTVIVCLAWISFPTPFGINLSFSILGVCLTAFVLGSKTAVASTVVYLVLGAAGLPVFSYFTGGIGVLFGVSGGFLWGFLITAFLCGIAKNITQKAFKYSIMVLSVLVCHIAGVIQYSIVTGNTWWISFLSASAPFLVKDIILVFLANILSKKIKI